MGQDNFPIAAVRHFTDAWILGENGRENNAMCHYAFSAECAVKALYEGICGVRIGRKLSHGVEDTYSELMDLYSLVRMQDVRTDLLLENMPLPARLFWNHPVRRYWKDIHFTEEELAETHEFTEKLIQELIYQVMDGRIIINDI